MNQRIVYIKDAHEITVAPKFVYCASTYRFWNTGASLIDEKYYVSLRPMNFKKVISKIKKKEYTIQRFIELKSAPQEYLITKGYKKKK